MKDEASNDVWSPWSKDYGAGIEGGVYRSTSDGRYYWRVRSGAGNGEAGGNEATSAAAIAACDEAAARCTDRARGALDRLHAAAKALREVRTAHEAVARASDAAWAEHRAQADREKQTMHDARPGHEGYCPLFAAFAAAEYMRRESEVRLREAERAVIGAALVEPP